MTSMAPQILKGLKQLRGTGDQDGRLLDVAAVSGLLPESALVEDHMLYSGVLRNLRPWMFMSQTRGMRILADRMPIMPYLK